MKKLIYTLVLIFCSVTLLQAGGDPIRKFYRKYKKREQVFNIAIPGLLTRTCVGVARIFVHDEEAKEGLKLARKMKGFRVLVDNGHQVPRAAGKGLIRELRTQKNMETLISVREKGSQTVIMGQIKGKKIKKIVVVTFSEDSFTMVAVKSRLKVKHVNRLINVLQKKQKRKKARAAKEKETERVGPMA